MKKKVLVIALIVVCLSILAYSTTAYFTYNDTATNVITMGKLRIEICETAFTNEGIVPFRDPINVLPGTSVSKIVEVKNVGAAAAWIRISLDESIVLAHNVYGTADLSLISYDINRTDWIEYDGYYYYIAPLMPGEATNPLFTKVYFSQYMGNMYQESVAFVNVHAEATQVANNGTNVLEALGWPSAD